MDVNQVNRLMQILFDFKDIPKFTPKRDINRELEIVIGNKTFLDYEDVYLFVEKIGFADKIVDRWGNNKYRITEFGKDFVDAGILEQYEATDVQNNMIENNLILENKFDADLQDPSDEIYRVITKDIFKKRQELKERIGEIGEEVVLDFERDRLKKAGFMLESKLVRNENPKRINLGYDISSFNGENASWNRFIEVKGTINNDFRFYLSRNEIRVAKREKEQYWIYFVSKIDVDKKTGVVHKMINNPYKKLHMKNLERKRTSSVRGLGEIEIVGESFLFTIK